MQTNHSINILLVDDDGDIRGAIAKLLSLEGYRIIEASNGLEALEALNSNEIHLILLDIMMPKLDGLSALMKIREKNNLPIIMLSAKSEDTDKVLGLSMGADDYISKPYSPQVLIARVKSQLRRYLELGVMESANPEVIRNGALALDTGTKQLFINGNDAKLTSTEYKIMEFLMQNLGMVFSADKIYESVWKEDSFGAENTVMVHIRRIREKIEIDPKNPDYLKVVWGIGYKIEKYT
ncbi:MAG: response regulator transcription factor [Bacillota bacterium]|nr:response regulator transcription factor [Bacillota bacterium]